MNKIEQISGLISNSQDEEFNNIELLTDIYFNIQRVKEQMDRDSVSYNQEVGLDDLDSLIEDLLKVVFGSVEVLEDNIIKMIDDVFFYGTHLTVVTEDN